MIVLFPDKLTRDDVKRLGKLPSGVELGEPIIDTLGRRVSCHPFTPDDIAYLAKLEKVEVLEKLPTAATPVRDKKNAVIPPWVPIAVEMVEAPKEEPKEEPLEAPAEKLPAKP